MSHSLGNKAEALSDAGLRTGSALGLGFLQRQDWDSCSMPRGTWHLTGHQPTFRRWHQGEQDGLGWDNPPRSGGAGHSKDKASGTQKAGAMLVLQEFRVHEL